MGRRVSNLHVWRSSPASWARFPPNGRVNTAPAHCQATPYDFPHPDVLSIPNPAHSGSSWKGIATSLGRTSAQVNFPAAGGDCVVSTFSEVFRVADARLESLAALAEPTRPLP